MRILIVEDEPDLRRLMSEMLEDEGYAVDAAAEGIDGLARARAWPYDALILDLQIPGIDGWDLLEELRITHRTPVLIVSARDALSDRVLGLDLGADDYLVKPFERVELLARLRALIRRAAGQAQATMTLGDYVIDLPGRRVRQGEETVSLTAREYTLLEYLVLHRGKVVSRTELYDHLFDENETSLSNLLEVHVSNLRKKLGSDLIETRRGQGYVIPAES
jgi:two-component system OmpR family response regulator